MTTTSSIPFWIAINNHGVLENWLVIKLVDGTIFPIDGPYCAGYVKLEN